jgi:hypothetical protein
MKPNSRDTFVLFCGDLHTGSTAALAPQRECRNKQQEALLVSWRDMTKRALAEAKGKDFLLMLGGDMVEGLHHGLTELYTTSIKKMRDDAVSLLMPLANAASVIYGIRGTSVHAGAEGEDDQEVCEKLGAKSADYLWTMTVGGKRLFWSHHGASVSRDTKNESNGLYADAERHYQVSLKHRQPAPDLVVHHHVHVAPPPVTSHFVTAAICPCWKLSDEHGARIRPEITPDIGVLAWHPASGKPPEIWPYQIKDVSSSYTIYTHLPSRRSHLLSR